MRIGNDRIRIPETYLQGAQPKPDVQSTGVPVDQVTISAEGALLGKARQALDALPAVREEKVAEIAIKVENGTYQVDSRKIADAMLREDQLARNPWMPS